MADTEGQIVKRDYSSRFDLDELWRFVLTVRKNYRKVPYHNWTHAFAVAHCMYLVIRSAEEKFSALEVGLGVQRTCISFGLCLQYTALKKVIMVWRQTLVELIQCGKLTRNASSHNHWYCHPIQYCLAPSQNMAYITVSPELLGTLMQWL